MMNGGPNGASFAYIFNEFFLIYVALFSLLVFTLITAAAGLDLAAIGRRFDAGTPRGPVAFFLLLMGLMPIAIWLGQIVPFLVSGVVPEAVMVSENGILFVYALDLRLVMPLSLLGAVRLWRRQPWGYVLAGYVLIKAATMILAPAASAWRCGPSANAGRSTWQGTCSPCTEGGRL